MFYVYMVVVQVCIYLYIAKVPNEIIGKVFFFFSNKLIIKVTIWISAAEGTQKPFNDIILWFKHFKLNFNL